MKNKYEAFSPLGEYADVNNQEGSPQISLCFDTAGNLEWTTFDLLVHPAMRDVITEKVKFEVIDYLETRPPKVVLSNTP